ncbi:MAG: polysaccharide deacetylase family protein [Armatimonadota bacterium]
MNRKQIHKPVPPKLVVLTFDDAARSHATFVAPLLKKLGFTATFFVGEFPGFENKKHYMSWEQIAALHQMGFEIGNHTQNHPDLRQLDATQQHSEVVVIEQRCRQYGIPVPETFAYPGCITTPETLTMLPQKGYTLARVCGGRACNPSTTNPMQVPAITPGGELNSFIDTLKQAAPGEISVFIFHGVPDDAHPECTVPPELFAEYMSYLKKNRYKTIAMRELADYFAPNQIGLAQLAKELYRPFSLRKGIQVSREGLMFVEAQEGQPASAKLLFRPTKDLELFSADELTLYEAGRDYIWHPNDRAITLTPKSRIPFFTLKQQRPERDSPNSWAQFRGGSHALLYSGGSYFHERQVVANYRHRDAWRGYRQSSETSLLPASLNKLRSGKPLRVSLLGDSISTGDNASGKTAIAPYQPFYMDLVVEELRRHFGSDLPFNNRSVGGMSSDWGITRVDTVAADKPELCLIAFGMNDIWGFTPDEYAEHIRTIMAGIKAKCPKVEFLLIAGMLPNPEWVSAENEAKFPQYLKQLQSMRTQGVAVADVGSLWHDVYLLKGFMSLTGNGLNHPNDYGHRLYAQVILASLGIEIFA